MIAAIATLEVIDGKQEEFEALARIIMANVKANEPGTTFHQLYKLKKSDTTYIFMEEFDSRDSFGAHMSADYLKETQPKVDKLLAKEMDVKVFDIVR